MTPEQLKASILQYAVEGKLVKQNPNDEPASELIKKIENEKNELVKEGKISKLRKASPISDEEKAFRIPNNWKWVRLEEIAQLNTGTTPSIGKSRYEGNYIPFIKPGDISSKGINYNNFGLSKDGLKHGRLIDENSLLTVCIGGSTGKTYYTDRAISCNQQINASTPYKGVSVMFLFYEMLSNHFQEEIHQHASGSATPIINKTKFGNLCLPLPPLEEQKRIVTKIEKLMPLVDEYAESYNRLQKIDNEFEDKLKQSVLQYAMEGKLVKQNPSDEPASELIKKIENEKAELVKEGKIKKSKKLPAITDDEKPFDIPDSWEWVRLGDIGDWGAGATPSRQHPEYYGGDVLWLKTGDLNDGVIQDTSEKITEAGVANSSVKVNQPGNILIAMYGATIGKLGIVGKTLVTNQACCGCTPFKGIYNLYLFYYLLSARNRLIELGSGGAQPNISKTKIENFVFPLPPLEEQKRIVIKIEKFMNSMSNLSK
ncbi:restriction endonuclease subunit S [Lactobacillus helveticus]|uniref:restriction endonuclease subunit S n=1 Tax=Lactobacillus helveticus TaxID=1587 RepID=UPI0015627A9A|nr:restriction endonuclease subunit S [Lactobacillus helveticus]NRO01589.1 Type-1 restriction enzyme EcoKI specificity protein [Lactobacillus helveticus]NRO92879.1 Type-1 restriction enzyme EcoKI specificity protein [Lactobacillus helveticus]